MAVTFTTTGAGNFEEILSGWSITEDATPVAPGDSSGGTGDGSITLSSGDDVEYLTDNTYTFTHDVLGTLSGKILALTSNGASVGTNTTAALSLSTALSAYSPNRKIPALEWASAKTIIENAVRSVTGWTLALPTNGIGYSYPIFGGTRGYNERGEMSGSFLCLFPFDQLQAVSAPVYTPTSTGAVNIVGQWSSLADNPGSLLPLIYERNYSLVISATVTSGTTFGQQLAVGEGPFSPSYDNIFQWSINNSTNLISVITASNSSSVSMATLDKTRPISFRVNLRPGSNYMVSATDANGVSVSTNVPFTFSPRTNNKVSVYKWGNSTLTSNSNITIHGIQMGVITSGWPSTYYLTPQTFSIVDASTSTEVLAVPEYSGSVWEYMKMASSALGIQLSAPNGVVTIDDVGGTPIVIDNYISGSVKLSIDSTQPAKAVTITTTKSSSGFGKIVAAKEGDNLFTSINVGDFIVKSIKTTNYATSITQPLGPADVSLPGYYYVKDSAGTIVLGADWTNAGGSLTAAINEDNSSVIDITITGPSRVIGTTNPPYQIKTGVYDPTLPSNGVEASSVDIYGMAVFTNPEDITILTGAATDGVIADNAGDVNNIFINTVSKAYTRGSWRVSQVNGNNITLSLSVPTGSVPVFGDWAGTRISFKDSVYRVTSATINNETVDIKASRYVTWADFAASNTFANYTQFVSYWANKTYNDFKIKPLKNT